MPADSHQDAHEEAHRRAYARHDEREQLQRLLSLTVPRGRAELVKAAQLSFRIEEEDRAGKVEAEELSALLTEYDSLRQESMNTINNRTQILLLGMAAVAAMVGGSLTVEGLAQNRPLVFAIFSAGVPLVAIFVLMVWLSEAERSRRAGYYLASTVEPRINARFGRLVLSWEAVLASGLLPRDEFLGPSMMSLGIIGLMALVSPAAGVWLTGTTLSWHGRVLWEVWIPYGALGLAGFYGIKHLPRLRNYPEPLSPFYGSGEGAGDGRHGGPQPDAPQ